MIALKMKAPKENGTLILKRTFNQKMYNRDLHVIGIERFWRIIGPAVHPNLNSDISLEWLKEKGYICSH